LDLLVLRLLEIALDQSGKGEVLVEKGGIPQSFFPIACELIHLQLGDGGKLVLHLSAEMLQVTLVIQAAGGDDDRRQDEENEDE